MTFIDERVLTPRQLDIVGAACQVFGNHGYRSGTVQLIAAEAGLSQAGVLHHFPTKDAILLAVIEHREQEDLSVLLPALGEGISVVEAFQKVLRKNAKRPELMRLFAVLSAEAVNPDHPAHDFFQRRYNYLISEVTIAVKSNQDDGVLRSDVDAEEIARMIIGVMDGLRYQVLIGNDPREHWQHLPALLAVLRGSEA